MSASEIAGEPCWRLVAAPRRRRGAMIVRRACVSAIGETPTGCVHSRECGDPAFRLRILRGPNTSLQETTHERGLYRRRKRCRPRRSRLAMPRSRADLCTHGAADGRSWR